MASSAPTIETFRRVVTLKDGARVLFRPLTPDDRTALEQLFLPVTDDERESFRHDITPELIKQWTENIDYDTVLPIVAEVRGEIIGEGTIHYRTHAHRHIAEVRVFLDRSWRRRGVGRFLVETLIDIARRQGLHLLTAQIVSAHTHVIKAFMEMGFEVKATLDDYFMLPNGRTMDVVFLINQLVSSAADF